MYSDAGVDASYEVVDCIVCKIVSKKLVEGAVATLGYNCTALYDGCFGVSKGKVWPSSKKRLRLAELFLTEEREVANADDDLHDHANPESGVAETLTHVVGH